MPRSIPAIRCFLPMIALAGLAGCAPPLPDMPPLACPVASTEQPYGIPEPAESIKRPEYWREAVNHGSNIELSTLIRDAQSGFYGQVDRGLVQYGLAAQRFRLENNCPDVPNDPML